MGSSAQNGKKAVWFLSSKKQQAKENYCRIYLLPVSGEIFERLLYDSVFMLPLKGKNLSRCSKKLIHFCKKLPFYWIAGRENIL